MRLTTFAGIAMGLQAMVAWAGPVELADIQRPSGWMLALVVGVGVKIFRTLGRS